VFSRTHNVLAAATADGDVVFWHATSQKSLYTLEQSENQTYTIDFCEDASSFATGGRDTMVRTYDETTRQETMLFEGHSNRVFAVKFKDPNVLMSGGWDNTGIFSFVFLLIVHTQFIFGTLARANRSV
jgi:COMPASS component SWD3